MASDERTMANARARARCANVAMAQGFVLLVLIGCSAAKDAGPRGGGGGGASSAAANGGGGGSATQSGGAGTAVGNGSGAGAGGSGTGSGPRTDGGAGAPQPCSTIGSTRSCCNTGTQTCSGNAEFAVWGPCLDSGGATMDCTNTCKNDEFGKCDAGIDAGVDSGKPPGPPDAGKDSGHAMPDAGCGPGMECKPGAIRYCDDPAGEWTKATCTASGMWGPCEVTTVPDGATGLGDCSPTDYSPEMCCPQLFLCCQNDPNGAFEDWGSGACAAVSCP